MTATCVRCQRELSDEQYKGVVWCYVTADLSSGGGPVHMWQCPCGAFTARNATDKTPAEPAPFHDYDSALPGLAPPDPNRPWRVDGYDV